MNKKANLNLNMIGLTSFLLSFLLIFISLRLETNTETIIVLSRYLLGILGILSGALFILIEVLLFMVLNNKFKILFIVYMILDIIMALYINSLYPYSFVLVFIGFRIIKDINRIIFVDKIYIPNKLNKYLRMYNIKLSTITGEKKKSTKEKKKTVVKIPKKNTIKEKAEV